MDINLLNGDERECATTPTSPPEGWAVITTNSDHLIRGFAHPA